MKTISFYWKRMTEGKKYQAGITLLLVILVLASLMTISLGIFNVAFTEIVIAGELSNSFKALYAAGQGIEYMTYVNLVEEPSWRDDLVASNDCSPGAPCAYPTDTYKLPYGNVSGCVYGKYDVTMLSDGIDTIKITSTGNSTNQTDCSDTPRTTKRSFSATYKF